VQVEGVDDDGVVGGRRVLLSGDDDVEGVLSVGRVRVAVEPLLEVLASLAVGVDGVDLCASR
jgi:hypothetical protein